jgi:hypothetical protein
MAVVAAFGTLANTAHAGLTAYFRATGCTAITMADVLPLLSKITTYADEYVIGEMKIWDAGSESPEPNNCAMVRVMVYNDGWIVAWFDKESQNQGATSSCAFVDAQTLSGFGTFCEYPDKWNGHHLKVTNSNGAGADDPGCPDGTTFCIRNTDPINGRIQVFKVESYSFHTGNTYDVEIYMTNGNLFWSGYSSGDQGMPPNLANRLYRTIVEMWALLRYSSNSTDSTDTAITVAFLDDGGVFTNKTTDFNDDGANDCPLMPATEVVNDAFYYGSSNKFRGLNLNIGTAGVGNTIVWEYWDGSAWSSLTVTDATNGFTVLGANTVTFTPYDDWAKTIVNSSEQYWIRSRVSVAAFTTQPLLTQGWIIVPDTFAYTSTNLGMYSFEDVAANYCLICGVQIGQDNVGNKYFYNTVLPGKVIYSHVFCYGYNADRVIVYVNDHQMKYVWSSIHQFSNGYVNRNIEDIDQNAGIQNVFGLYWEDSWTIMDVAVLITS